MINLVIDPRDPELEPLGPSADGSKYRPVQVSVATSRPVRLVGGGFVLDAPMVEQIPVGGSLTVVVPATDGAEVLEADRSTFVYVVALTYARVGKSRETVTRTFTGLLPTSLGATVQVTELVNSEPLPAPYTSIQDIIDGVADVNDPATASLVTNASSTRTALDSRYEGRQSTYRATGSDTAAQINTFLASGSPLGVKQLVGSFTVAATLTIAAADTYVDLSSAKITTSVAAGNAVTVTAANVTIRGGEIVSPATFSGTNVQWTYAVIKATAPGLKVLGVTLTNVPKVGIGADDTDDLTVTGCTIVGNFPAGSWTGTETGHYGVAVNPGSSGRSGRTVISGNIVRSCVQGVFLGNYGAGTGVGATITGNVLDGCHNHGVYGSNGWSGVTVSGNSFARCSLPIALTGPNHAVTGNNLTTDGTGNNLDLTGISIREADGCTVVGNVIKGDAPAGAVIVELGNYSGTTVARNVVANNTIDVTGGSSIGIRVGRSPSTDVSDNIVADNYVRSVGTAGSGVITITSAVAGAGNKVTGNAVVVLGDSHGIKADKVTHSTIQNNSIRYEYDAPSAKVLGAVVLNATTYCTVSMNDVYCSAAWGTNVTLRGVWEQSTSSKNRVVQNGYHGDLTKLAVFTPITLITNSDAYLDERGLGSPTGAFFGAPGSRWSREDGGASTSLYVKETANTSATWRAV